MLRDREQGHGKPRAAHPHSSHPPGAIHFQKSPSSHLVTHQLPKTEKSVLVDQKLMVMLCVLVNVAGRA